MEKKYQRGLQSFTPPLFSSSCPWSPPPPPPPPFWITNSNPKWLTDSRHHVSTVRKQSSGSLTERVPSHLYPGPSPKAILERGWTIDLTPRINSISRLSLHLKTWISEVDPNKKAPFALRTLRVEQGQTVVQTFRGAFFFGLVWLAVLQLHLIPTGKPSSGTDFRVPGPGWEKGGNCSVKAWFPSGVQASSQSFWLKGVLAQLHPMTGPCS